MASVTHLTNQSQFVQSNAVFNGTNATGTIASNGISVSVNPQTAFVLSNSNGITFGTNGSTVTASHNGLTSQSNQAWSGSNASSTFQTLSFNNANGVSWSNNGGAVEITHGLQFTSNTSAITSNALHTSSPRINISAGTTSNNLSALTFSNGNGVSFGLNGSTITASVAAAGGAQTGISGIVASDATYTSGTVIHSAQANITIGSSVNGASQYVRYSVAPTPSQATQVYDVGSAGSTGTVTRYALEDHVHAGVVRIHAGSNTGNTAGNTLGRHGDWVVAGSNNITISGSTGGAGVHTVWVSGPNLTQYLTTARASNDAVGLNTALTAGPLAWTVNSSGISLNAGSAAGTTSGFGGNLISGSMTHNTAGLNLSLNHPAWLTTAMQSNAATISNIRVSAGTTSNLLSAITFNDGNGISFGLNASTLTASHNALTSQSNQNVTAGNGGFAFQTLSFSNVNGISFGTSAGSAITASHNALTTARASNDAIGLNTAQSNVTWTVNSSGLSLDARGYAGTGTTFNGANISGSMTVNSVGVQLSLSAGVGGGVTPVASASNGSFSFTTLAFSNANNVTFGTSAGSIITASVAAPGAAAENNWVNLLGANTAGNTTASGSTVGWSGINVTLSGTNGSVVNISAPPVSSLVGASGISLSTNGSTISVGKVLQSTYVPFEPYSTNSQTLAALGATSGSARFFPIFISDNIAFNALRVMHNLSYATSSVSGQQTITYGYGLFSNNAGTLSSISSSSFSLAVTNSSVSNTVSYPVSTGTGGYTYTTLSQSTTANIQSFWGTAAGGRPLDLQFGNSMTLSSGQYWLGVNLRHSSSSANIGVSIALGGNANALWNSLAPWGVASSAQTTNSAYRVPYAGLGAYTVSQSSLPNGVPLTQIAHTQTIMPLLSFLSTS